MKTISVKVEIELEIPVPGDIENWSDAELLEGVESEWEIAVDNYDERVLPQLQAIVEQMREVQSR